MFQSATVRINLVWLPLLAAVAAPLAAQVRFEDDFEGDLTDWELVGGHAIQVIDSGDEAHGRVLELTPDGAVYALIEDSDRWGGVRLEAEVLFPDDKDNYLGLIYNFQRRGSRTDFGSLYIKGNGSYIRANPWRDGNASRLLYEEYRTPLEGDDAIVIGRWQKLKAEIVGRLCHLYVGDMAVPKVTFSLFELDAGRVGFKPRVVGWPVWIDNVRVSSIEGLAYEGPDLPEVAYEPAALVTEWQAIGPLTRPSVDVERSTAADGSPSWRPFATDARGAVITGRLTEYAGERPVAYFRTVIRAASRKAAVIHFSNVDELALYVNGRFHGYVYRQGYVGGSSWNAWFDFWRNPEHAGRRVSLELEPGNNQIVVRARNGQFASGGFFARLEEE